jgi:hypothetical protein
MAKRIKFLLVLLFSILLFVVVLESISTAFAPGQAARGPVGIHREPLSPAIESRELNKIVGVLEGLAGNDRLPEKVIRKLRNMKSRDLGTISSLCDRISRAGDTASPDVAFMLITAMIFVS